MTAEKLVQKYMLYCQTQSCINVKSIVPVEYRLIVCANGVVNGIVKLQATTYSGKTVIIEHRDVSSYASNLHSLMQM